MLMSVCLQSIVDELLCQKDDHDFSRLTVRSRVKLLYIQVRILFLSNRTAKAATNEAIATSDGPLVYTSWRENLQ